MDHYSRRVMGLGVFQNPPTSAQVRALLGRTMQANAVRPKYLICDKGEQFIAKGFKAWCGRKNVRLRYGALGQHGSIAVIERFWLTLKQECTRVMMVPLRRVDFRRELRYFTDWFNRHRPHMALYGLTPEEVYRGHADESESVCIDPVKNDDRVSMDVHYHAGRRHLPIVTLKRAA